jgi:hypothetical protein
MPSRRELAAAIRRLRERPRPGLPEGLKPAEAARRTSLGPKDTEIKRSYWSQVEGGDIRPSAQKLMAMTQACDATPEETKTIFHLAGYGHLYDTLTGIGRTRATVPGSAEEVVQADTQLSYQDRRTLLHLIRRLREAEEARRLRRVAAPQSKARRTSRS